MRAFKYASAAAVDEALALLSDGDGAGDGVRPLAGGTDLLTLMKADIAAPSQLIDIKRLPEMAGVTERAGGLVLGALTTLAELESNPLIAARYPILAEAASVAATPQLRNMATVGGNLLQRSRCWYYRNPRFHCWLKGGDVCQARDGENQLHAIFGDSPCLSAHPSDIAPALLALDAEVTVRGPSGERTLTLSELFALPEEGRRTETVLRPDELVLSIRVPAPEPGMRGTYLKAMDRKSWAFALAGVAAVLRLDGRRIVHARIALAGVAPIPWRTTAAEDALLGAQAGDDAFARAADLAVEGATPLRDNGYKVALTRALVRRALDRVAISG